MIFRVGRFSNGSAASRAASRERGKARRSSGVTSSKRRRVLLTILQALAPTRKQCARFSDLRNSGAISRLRKRWTPKEKSKKGARPRSFVRAAEGGRYTDERL